MQTLSINYLVFIPTLLALFAINLAYAYLIVRRVARARTQGQTAGLVVIGVGEVVLISALLIGWLNMLLVLACFAAAGAPRVIEYHQRVDDEQKQDQKEAEKIVKDLMK